MIMKKKFLVSIIGIVFLLSISAFASAQSLDEETIQILQQQIQELQAKIAELQAQITGLQKEVVELKESIQITQNLFRGISSDEVKDLQTFLSTDPDVYPEGLITGFFGPLT